MIPHIHIIAVLIPRQGGSILFNLSLHISPGTRGTRKIYKERCLFLKQVIEHADTDFFGFGV